MSWVVLYIIGVALVALWSLSDDIQDLSGALWLGLWWPLFALTVAFLAGLLVMGVGFALCSGLAWMLGEALKALRRAASSIRCCIRAWYQAMNDDDWPNKG